MKLLVWANMTCFQFDEEERTAAEQERQDAALAHSLASQSHDLSESDDDDVVLLSNNGSLPQAATPEVVLDDSDEAATPDLPLEKGRP